MSKHNEELHAVPSLLELAEQLENKAAEEKNTEANAGQRRRPNRTANREGRPVRRHGQKRSGASIGG